MHLFQALAEFAELIVQGPQEEIEGRLMLAAEAVALLMEDAVGCGLKMRFDLPPVFREEGFPFLKLLAHAGAGALHGGIVHVQIAAFPVQRPAFGLKATQLFFLALAGFLHPFQPGREDEHLVLAALARKQPHNEAQHEAKTKAKEQGDWLQICAKLGNCVLVGQGIGGGKDCSVPLGHAAQGGQFIQQVEHQGASWQVDAQILLQPGHGLHPVDGDHGKSPIIR